MEERIVHFLQFLLKLCLKMPDVAFVHGDILVLHKVFLIVGSFRAQCMKQCMPMKRGSQHDIL